MLILGGSKCYSKKLSAALFQAQSFTLLPSHLFRAENKQECGKAGSADEFAAMLRQHNPRTLSIGFVWYARAGC